ncbi:YbcC family protein [Mariniflexile jejuense]|uniref:Probable inorganic carbon transporter subunit DabA n=1 Tax=Mariniflexile jejuense TaxID=1173582 RepID=A0ABW3JFF8_9FLAO
MNTNQIGFEEHHVLHDLKHYLPAQNPLKDFVHHNTLHAFQQKHFFEALHEASEIFGYKTYLSLSDFRNRFLKNEISESVLDYVINKRKKGNEFQLWKTNLLKKEYDEQLTCRIGYLRSFWKNEYAINLDKSTHGILFRVLCSYLDQGISIWSFPVHDEGFLNSLKKLNTTSFNGIFSTKRAKELLDKGTTITELLSIIVGNEAYFETYLFDQQFSHPGWSGMVVTIENNPNSLLDKRKITFEELIIFELLLELDALDKKFGENWAPITHRFKIDSVNLFKPVFYSEYYEVLSLWQEAFEWSFYDQVLSGIKNVEPLNSVYQTSFQAMFCMDDRECSFRRYVESLDKNSKTFGTAAFFNFEFFYKPVNGKFYTKLCPAPLTPKYLIKEVDRKKKQAKDFHYNKKSHSLFFGWIISQTLGFSAAFKLFVNIFKPTMTPATSASFKHLNKKSKLVIENSNSNEKENDLQVGFTIEEMANRAEGLLKSIGLVKDFAPIVYIIGHGATSVNNTHYAGYDCGACSGRPSSVNAKVACFAINHPKVRVVLKERGIIIPESTQFSPALHDTTRDEIAFYDEDMLSQENKTLHQQNAITFTKALDLNAKERSRRFDTVKTNQTLEKVHEKIKRRSVSLFEPRPELNHATNAMCIVGRRSLSKQLFLDRRSFMNSYDYTVDPTGDYLVGILGAVAPVGGGINLEYYFSRVDNHKLGAGSKLPHNVMGLIGVANGIDGDLRPGLPSQMIEVHDPIRLLVIVEHYPEIVKYAITKNPATYEWFINEWVKLVVVNPETGDLFHFEKGDFKSYIPIQKDANYVKDVQKLAEESQENLQVGILN